jgi:hypothetical protein
MTATTSGVRYFSQAVAPLAAQSPPFAGPLVAAAEFADVPPLPEVDAPCEHAANAHNEHASAMFLCSECFMVFFPR